MRKLVLLGILALAPLSANAGVVKLAVKRVVKPAARAVKTVAKVTYKVIV